MSTSHSVDQEFNCLQDGNNGLVNMNSSRELDDEEKYWRAKIVHSALQTVLFNPNPESDTKLSPEAREYLKACFCDETTSNEAANGKPPLPAEVQAALEADVAMEIQKMAKSLVDSTVHLLRADVSHDKAEDWLQRLQTSCEPLRDVLVLSEERKQQENQLDRQIQQGKTVRNGELEQLEEEIKKVTKTMENVTELMSIQKQPEALHKRLETLNAKSSDLASAVKTAKKEKLVLEYSPEVEELTEDIGAKLEAATQEARKENAELKAFFEEYDNLDPELKELISKLKATEDAIERQKWILENIRNSDGLDDDDGFQDD